MTFIKKLTLTNYRVYENNIFNFDKNINIIYGRNGLGKTNILEALSYLSPGKGFLNSNIMEVLNFYKTNSCGWSIFSELENNPIVDTVSVYGEPDGGIVRKKIKINNNPAKTQDELSKIFNIIWLTPDMQNFFNDATSVRRKFLDRIVYMIDNTHSSRVAKYEFFVKERIKVLTDNYKFDKNWLSILEEKIAETGVSIAVARNEIVKHLNQLLENYEFNFPKFIISIDGYFENILLDNIKSLEVEKIFKDILFKNRDDDKNSKRTNAGVHKSDLRLFYQTKNIDAQFASTGEQKLFLISFTILKALLCKKLSKADPIILLDEVFSYLDKSKKMELFNELLKLNIQSFITGTEVGLFADLGCEDMVKFIDLEKVL